MLLSIIQKVVNNRSFCGNSCKQNLTLVLLSGHQFPQLFLLVLFCFVLFKKLSQVPSCFQELVISLTYPIYNFTYKKVHVTRQEKLPTTMPLQRVQGRQKFSYINISTAFESPPRIPQKYSKIILRILLICSLSTLRPRKR